MAHTLSDWQYAVANGDTQRGFQDWFDAEAEAQSADPDAFDALIDDATHAVNNLIPDARLAKLSPDDHSELLVRINDALAPIIRDVMAA